MMHQQSGNIIVEKHAKCDCRNIPEQYKCHQCVDFQTNFLIHLKQHFADNHKTRAESDLQLYECTKCHLNTYSKYLILRHNFFEECSVGIEHNITKAESCVHEMRNIDNLRDLLQLHYPGNQNCSKSSLKHVSSKHTCKDQNQWFYCHHCYYTTMSESILKEHMKNIHTLSDQTEWLHCNQCYYKGKSRQLLVEHTKPIHTPQDQIKWFYCDQCDYKAKAKQFLQRHIKSKHTLDQKWLQCGQRDCKSKGRIKNKHTAKDDVKWFYCDHCYCKYKSQKKLKRHIQRNHTDHQTKQFCCHKCDYNSIWKSSLKRHIMRKHTPGDQIEWFNCDQCNYKTKAKQYLPHHIKSKHAPDQKWFHCDQCDCKCKSKCDLDIHKQHKHTSGERMWLYGKSMFA